MTRDLCVPAAGRGIPRRDLAFRFEPGSVPRSWCAGDPFVTSVVAGLSMVFPPGERFFVESVRRVRDRITSPELRAQVAGFVGQETMHGREHRALNRLLVAHGYTAAPAIEARVGAFLARARAVLSPASRLAITCALEHFTAILAERLLGDQRLQAELDPSVRPLWLWHAYEEAEHKAVAFDVYRAIGGGEVRRLIMMVVTTALFLSIMAIIQTRLMAQRGLLFRPLSWLRGLFRLWVWPGHFSRVIPAYLAYYRPGFHPSDRDNRALLAAWQERLFGGGGELGAYRGGAR